MTTLRVPWTAACIAGAVLISVACLLSTYLLADLGPQIPPRVKWLMYLLSLSFENNFGAWWSSMLLLAASLLAFDSGQHARAAGQGSVGLGWWALAALLLVLSIDEGASIHERVDSLPVGTKPFGLVLVALAGVGLWNLWKAPAYCGHVMGFAAAFLLLATVPVQEHLEVAKVQLGGSEGMRALLEEGTEITAMLILLITTARGALSPAVSRAGQDSRAFAWVDQYPRIALWGALGVAPFVAELSAVLPDQHRGRPAAWFAAALALFAALSLVRSMSNGRFVPRMRELLLAAGAVLLSLQVFTFDLAPYTSRRLVISVLFVLIALVYSLWPSGHKRLLRHYALPLAAAAFAAIVHGSQKLVILNVMVICASLAIWLAAAYPHSAVPVKWYLSLRKREA